MNKWFLLPGMGASAAMYNGLKRAIAFDVTFINWPAYRGEQSYADVARRVIDEYGIDAGDVVGGSSLGGMVSLEIARIVDAKAVVLIGSAMRSQEVQTLLTKISSAAALAPISSLQVLIGKRQDLVSSMFAVSDPDFIRAMCAYLRQWRGYEGRPDRVYRLHGKKDHVIPCPGTGCDVIDDAGHLIAITHVEETAVFLEKTRSLLASCSQG